MKLRSDPRLVILSQIVGMLVLVNVCRGAGLLYPLELTFEAWWHGSPVMIEDARVGAIFLAWCAPLIVGMMCGAHSRLHSGIHLPVIGLLAFPLVAIFLSPVVDFMTRRHASLNMLVTVPTIASMIVIAVFACEIARTMRRDATR